MRREKPIKRRNPSGEIVWMARCAAGVNDADLAEIAGQPRRDDAGALHPCD
jgi:hypothetical protein